MNPSTHSPHSTVKSGSQLGTLKIAAGGALALILATSQPVLADNNWDGGAANGNWSDALNWGADAVPAFPTVTPLVFGGTLQLASVNDFSAGQTVNGFTFSPAAGAFVITGNAITLGGAITNSSTALQTVNLNMATTAAQTVTMTTGGGDITLGGDLSGTGGALNIAGAGTLTLTGNNSFTGFQDFASPLIAHGVQTAANTTLNIGSNTALGASSAFLRTIGGTVQASGGARTVANGIAANGGTTIIGGSNNLTFNGQVITTTSGTTLTINNSALTTFAGGIGIRGESTATNRTLTINGTGNLMVSGAVTDGMAGATAENLTYTGTGTLTMSGANTFSGNALYSGSGFGTIAGGNLSTVVLDRGASTGSGTNAGNTTIGTATSNARLLVKGDYGLSLGAATKTLIITGGNGTTTGQGMLSLQDGVKNTFTLTNTNTNANDALRFNSGAGGSVLAMDIGNSGADSIVLSGAGRLRINTASTNVTVNLNGIGGQVAGTYQLITASTLSLNSGTFVTGTTTGNFGGFTSAVVSSNATGVQVVLSGPTAAPATAYWAGDVDANWNTFTDGTLNNTNWSSTSSGLGTNVMQIPDSTSDVIFSVATPSNTATSLAQNFSVKSVAFNSGTASVAGPSTLTIGSGGLSASGTAVGTISAPVTMSSSNWTTNSSGDLTVSGAVTTSAGITKAGTGALVLSGNNTGFTGGLTVNNGTVRLGNAGALNSGTPQTVSFGNTGGTNPTLQLNGNTLTTGALSAATGSASTVIENANASPATLTVSQSSNTSYSGVIRDGTGSAALGLVKSGSGTLILSGSNSYTGSTSVNAGTLLVNGTNSGSGAVTVNSGGTLGGGIIGTPGTVGGAVTVASGGRITAGDIGTIGALSLSSGLTIASGGVAYFDINDNSTFDSIGVTGNLTLNSGTIIKVPSGLTTSTSYDLFTYTGTGPSDLLGITFQNQAGGALSGTYGFSIVGSNTIRLTITGATTAIPSISITSPAGGTRVMANTSVSVGGNFGNTGVADLHGTLADNNGQLTVSSFSPSGSTTIAPSGTQAYTAGISDTGSTLGSRTFSIKVSDPAASPTSTSATSTLDVLGNRTVNASTVVYGNVHVNAAAAGNTTLASAQLDDQYTRVTVANGTNGSGFAVSGGNTATVFNGTNSDVRSVAGTFTSVGPQSGSISLNTTGEGLSGESPINVSAGYNASVFSGTAAWASNASGSWVTQANWGDTNAGNLNGAGAPGLDGAASIGDTATFGDVIGLGATATVSLNGVSPTLAAITFNSTSTAYTLATGSGGSITLQDAATPIAVTGTHTIAAVLAGSGLSKSGAGTLTLSAANTYTGATAITNGVVQLATGADRLPAGTTVTLGAGGNSGKLVLGSGATTANQTLAGLLISGSGGASNRVVGGASANSTLTVGVAAGTNIFGGTLGGVGGANENNLALTKTGAGALILDNSPTYTGTTTITQGLLQTPTGADLTGFITFGGNSVATAGILQTSGTLAKNLSGTVAAGNLNWVSFNGFAAKGGALTVTMNSGGGLTWGSGNFMGTGGAAMVLGSTTADNQVNVTNAINLASTDNFQRPIYVEQGTGIASAKLSGVLSPGTGASGISKQGSGILILSGANTYSGATNVTAGTVKMENSSALGNSLNVAVGGISSGANATTVSTGATLDLNGQSGILETINLNGTGVGGNGALINSNIGAAASIDVGLTSIGIGAMGSGYTAPTLSITGGGGTGATGTIALTGVVGTSNITLTNAGSGYTSAPTVTINDGTGTLATATATVSGINIAGPSSIGGAGDITVNALVTGANALTKVGAGTVTLAGVNTFTGTATVNGGKLILATASGSALGATTAVTVSAGSLQLNTANQINDVAPMTLAGGTFNSNGLNETLGTLALTLDSVIDLANGTSVIHFASSSGVTWTPATTLSIWNWTGGSDQIFFGTNDTSLSFGQVSQIKFYSGAGTGLIGGAGLLNTGELVAVVPEPHEFAVGVAGFLGVLVLLRRRARKYAV